MNVSRYILAMAVAATIPALAEVKPGDSFQQVIAELGEPQGEIAAGDYRLLYFPRGKVELRDGKVTKAELVTEEQAEKSRQLREQQQAEATRIAAEAREKRIVDGTAVRQAKLADKDFMASPASERVAFWQNFKKLYPEVPLGSEYTTALRELEQEYAAQRIERQRQQQIGDLEKRVADAEDRARRAEQRHSSTIVYDSSPGYGYYPGWACYSPWYRVPQAAPPPSRPIPFTQARSSAAPQQRPATTFMYESSPPPYLVQPFTGGGISFSINTR